MNTRMMRRRSRGVTCSTCAHDPRALRGNGARRILMGLVLATSVAGAVSTPALAEMKAPAKDARRSLAAAGPTPIDLRSTAHFAILAGSAITSTGGGTNNGDVGLSPTTGAAIIGLSTAQVNGIVYAVDALGPAGSVVDSALLATAKVDLVMAYSDAAGRSADRITLTDGQNIGGTNLAPGLYGSASSLQITGDLTLDAGGDSNAVWIFQMVSTLTTEAGGVNDPHSRVILTGGAQARNIFWQVGSSATLGTFSVFKGTILALDSITMNTRCTVEGRALARNAAVTFDGQSISLPTPEAPRFTHISRTTADSVTVVLSTTPFFLLTLETSPDLLLTNWTTIATVTPVASPWTNTDDNATATVTQRFYRAFITAY